MTDHSGIRGVLRQAFGDTAVPRSPGRHPRAEFRILSKLVDGGSTVGRLNVDGLIDDPVNRFATSVYRTTRSVDVTPLGCPVQSCVQRLGEPFPQFRCIDEDWFA